jgi:hypothetical protein
MVQPANASEAIMAANYIVGDIVKLHTGKVAKIVGAEHPYFLVVFEPFNRKGIDEKYGEDGIKVTDIACYANPF